MKTFSAICTGFLILTAAGCLATPEPRPAEPNDPAERARVREQNRAPGQTNGAFNPFDYLEPAPAPRLE